MWMTTEKVARLFVEEFVSSDNMEIASHAKPSRLTT